MTPYRSDRAGRIEYAVNHYPVEIAATILTGWVAVIWIVLNLLPN